MTILSYFLAINPSKVQLWGRLFDSGWLATFKYPTGVNKNSWFSFSEFAANFSNLSEAPSTLATPGSFEHAEVPVIINKFCYERW